jgi:hypothetical protein
MVIITCSAIPATSTNENSTIFAPSSLQLLSTTNHVHQRFAPFQAYNATRAETLEFSAIEAKVR